CHNLIVFTCIIALPLTSPNFPYTTLFRSQLQIIPEAVIQGDYQVASGYRAMKKILLLPEVPDLVFCGNDDMAIGAMKACYELGRSEEHTSELQSRFDLVCRLLLEKKKILS